MKSLLLLSLLIIAGFTAFPSHEIQVLNPITVSYAQEEVTLQEIEVVATDAVEEQVSSELPQIPEGDPIQSLVKLITDWKSMSPIALGIALVILLVQISKAGWIESLFKLFGWSHVLEWKRVIVTVSGVAYGVLYLINTGSHWVSALVVAVLSSGGAVAIYEAIKPLLPQKK